MTTATNNKSDHKSDVETKTRWFGVGTALKQEAESDTRSAVASAIREAVTGKALKLVMVMVSEELDFEQIRLGIGDAVTDERVKIIGCSAGAQHSKAHGAATGGIIVSALGGSGFQVQTGIADASEGDLYEAALEATTESVKGLEGENKMLLLWTDGLLGDSQEYVRGAFTAAGASWQLVGGASSDIGSFDNTWQFNGEERIRGVVAAAIVSDSPMSIGIAHGWEEAGTEPMLVTRSEGMKILELNARPALEVWAEHIGYEISEFADDPDLTAHLIMTHPLGLAREDRKEIRGLAGADIENKALIGVTVTPEGEATWIMKGSAESVLESTKAGVESAFDGLEGNEPIGLMGFGCMARRVVLTEPGYLDDEIEALADAAKGAPIAGMPVFGEIARTKGPRGFHNCTLITLAFS